MPLILLVLGIVSFFHLLVPAVYYFGMRRLSGKKTWNLDFLDSYEPKITLIVATYNEASTIEAKLDNIRELTYPPEKLEIIVVDSASTDGTAQVAENRLRKYGFPFNAVVLEENERKGKAKALNSALRVASGDIILTTDADCFWASQSLESSLRYLSSPSVGAVCGQELLMNPRESSVSRTESQHRNVFNSIRVGESKIQSTIIFEGALALYKKDLLGRFDEDCDDSGSALNLVQKGYRTLMVPDAHFLNPPPKNWGAKFSKKTRRSQHIVDVWWKCVKLSVRRKLKLNKLISACNIFLYLINPFLFIVFLATIAYLCFSYPVILVTIPIVLIVPRLRDAVLTYFSNYFFLLYGIFLQILHKKQVVWKK